MVSVFDGEKKGFGENRYICQIEGSYFIGGAGWLWILTSPFHFWVEQGMVVGGLFSWGDLFGEGYGLGSTPFGGMRQCCSCVLSLPK